MKSLFAKSSKLTKVICTIGPSCRQATTIAQMVVSGMNIARLNFSHGSHSDHLKNLSAIRKVEKDIGIPIAVVQDLCGPKIRVGMINNGEANIKRGESIRVQSKDTVGNKTCFSISEPKILRDIKVKNRIFIDDGLLELTVTHKDKSGLTARVENSGILKSRKGINLPDTEFSIPSVTDKDLSDLAWGIEHRVDYIALSFISSAKEIKTVRAKLAKSKSSIGIIAKIERRDAITNIEEIIDASDGIMIARGDMGVEIDSTQVPWVQKDIISKCWHLKKPVITATQMLESMVSHAHPTRAEVTDVTSAIIDGTDIVMLSAETAVGKYPVETVRMMSRIIETAEKSNHKTFNSNDFNINANDPYAAHLICIQGASLIQSKATIIIDPSGRESVVIAKIDRLKPIIVGVPNMEIARRVSFHHSIIPIIIHDISNSELAMIDVLTTSKNKGLLQSGDLVAYIEGDHLNPSYQQHAALRLIRIP